MKKTTLKFPNLQLLAQFDESLQDHPYLINAANNQLTLRCSNDNLQLAIDRYQAMVIENEPLILLKKIPASEGYEYERYDNNSF